MEETDVVREANQRYDADSLTEEMRQLDAATDGDTIEGIVTNVPDEASGETVEITIKTVLGEFTETFEKPKPPVEDYALTGFADRHGQGLADLNALEGETVDCTYDKANDTFSVKQPKSPLENARAAVGRLRKPDEHDEGEYRQFADNPVEYTLSTLLWPFVVAISFTDMVGEPYGDHWYYYGHANVRWLLWSAAMIALVVFIL